MNARRIVVLSLLMIGIVLGMGAPVEATAYTWIDGTLSVAGWTNPIYWTPDTGAGYPSSSADSATLSDPSPSHTCTMDLGSALTIDDLTLSGVSPTKMTLDLQDNALTVSDAIFGDYAQLEAKNNFTVTATTTFQNGDVWIAVSTTKTADLENVDTSGAQVYLHATTTGTFKANDVSIDAHADSATRAVRFAGGTWDIEDELIVKAVQGAGAYIAKLWLEAGSITPEFLRMNGGDHASRRVELDIDQNLTIGTDSEALGGYYTITVAAGKTMNTKKLVLSATGDETTNDVYFSVTGETGGGQAQGKLVTSE